MQSSHGAAELEQKYVHNVYSQIAPHFSSSRYKAWPKVSEFLTSLPAGSLVADVGCGNGKYFTINPRLFTVGCDVCPDLVSVARDQSNVCDCLLANNLSLPFKDGCFDAVISVAVIHHFATHERRLQAIRELVRVLKPTGKCLIYVWALEQSKRQFAGQDVLVPWHLHKKIADLKAEAQSDTCSIDSQTDLSISTSVPLPEKEKSMLLEDSLVDGQAVQQQPNPTIFKRIESYLPSLPKLFSSKSSVSNNDANNRDQSVHTKPDFKNLKLEFVQSPSSNAMPVGRRHSTPEVEERSLLAPLKTSRLARIARFSPLIGRKMSQIFGYDLKQALIDQLATECVQAAISAALRQYFSQEWPAIAAKNDAARKSLSAQAACTEDQNKNDSRDDNDTFYRYYHVFREKELDALLANISDVFILESYYDHANWCIVFQKQ